MMGPAKCLPLPLSDCVSDANCESCDLICDGIVRPGAGACERLASGPFDLSSPGRDPQLARPRRECCAERVLRRRRSFSLRAASQHGPASRERRGDAEPSPRSPEHRGDGKARRWNLRDAASGPCPVGIHRASPPQGAQRDRLATPRRSRRIPRFRGGFAAGHRQGL